MIKSIILKFECSICGTIFTIQRDIVIDEYLKKIDIDCSKKCPCGNLNKSKLKLLDIEI